MRKIHSFVILAALAALSSCTVKEELAVEPQQPLRFRGILEAVADGPETRAYANATYDLYWNNGDEITVFAKTMKRQKFYYDGRTGSTDGEFLLVEEAQSGFGGQAGEFTDPVAAQYNYAIYPYSKYHSMDYDGTMMVDYPQEQAYNTRGIKVSPVLVSRGKGSDLFFRHAAGYLGFYLYGSDVEVSSITLTSNNGETLSGYALIGFDEEENPIVSFPGNEVDSPSCTFSYSPAVKIGASAQEATVFWITLPPANLVKGLTLKVKDTNGGTFELKSSKSREIKRKVFQPFDPIEVEIQSVPVESVSVSPANVTLTLTQTETATLTASVLPANATDATVTWSSSNPSVATVTNGVVKAVAAGTAVITATAGEKSASSTVTVVDKISYSLALTAAKSEIDFNEELPFTATLTTVKNGVSTASTVNAALSATGAGSVSIDGLTVKGLSGGQVTITATYTPEGAAAVTATTTLTVKDVYEYSLAISPQNANIVVNQEQTFVVTLTTIKNGVSSDSTPAATITVDDTSVASVNGLKVKGLKTGEVTVTAKYTPEGSGELTAGTKLTVNEDPNQAGKPVPVGEEENL